MLSRVFYRWRISGVRLVYICDNFIVWCACACEVTEMRCKEHRRRRMWHSRIIVPTKEQRVCGFFVNLRAAHDGQCPCRRNPPAEMDVSVAHGSVEHLASETHRSHLCPSVCGQGQVSPDDRPRPHRLSGARSTSGRAPTGGMYVILGGRAVSSEAAIWNPPQKPSLATIRSARGYRTTQYTKVND